MDSLSRCAKQRRNFELIQSALHKAAPRLAAFKHQLYGKPEEEITREALEDVIKALYVLKEEREELDRKESHAKAVAQKYSKLNSVQRFLRNFFADYLSSKLFLSAIRSIRQ
jgi:phytoene dehydrogenase-like protein